MSRRYIAIALVALFASCKGSDTLSSDNNSKEPERKKLACADTHVDMNTPHIDWFEENNSILNKADELVVLPKNYQVYGADTAKMNAFFKAIKNGQTVSTVIPLPKPAGCQVFKASNNVKDHAKIPRGLTLALAEAQGQKAALSYNGQQLIGHIDWFGLPYEIKPIRANNKTYYIVYTKEIVEPTTNKNNATQSDIKMVEYKPVK